MIIKFQEEEVRQQGENIVQREVGFKIRLVSKRESMIAGSVGHYLSVPLLGRRFVLRRIHLFFS